MERTTQHFSARLTALLTHVLGVADGQLLALVAGQTDVFSHLVRDCSLVAAFTEQRVDRLDTVPA